MGSWHLLRNAHTLAAAAWQHLRDFGPKFAALLVILTLIVTPSHSPLKTFQDIFFFHAKVWFL